MEAFTKRYVQHPLIRENAVEYRDYQVNLANVSFGKNTLAILPTALGKTIIALLLTAEVLRKKGDAKVLVMAPTRPLAHQHKRTFAGLMNLPETAFVALTGTQRPEVREAIWAGDARIYFATPEVVRNDVDEGRLDIGSFSLIVFDEAHRAVKDYPYTSIAKAYVERSAYPMIFAMTASPGSTEERIMDVCRNLFIEQVFVKDESDPDVSPYINRVDINWVRVKLPPSYAEARSVIEEMLGRRLNWLAEKGFLQRAGSVSRKDLLELGDRLRHELDSNPSREDRGKLFQAIKVQSEAMSIYHMKELLETQGAVPLRSFMARIEREEKSSHTAIASDELYPRLVAVLERASEDHPKVGALVNIIREQLRENPLSKVIVFTQYRETVQHLVEVLQGIEGARVGRFVGQASREWDKGMSQDEQLQALRELEQGSINILVSTSIAEEGLDIPSVEHVIFFEPIPSEIRYIQRKGRTGRRGPGKVTILFTESSLDSAYLFSSIRKAKIMKEIVRRINSKLQPILRRLPSFPEGQEQQRNNVPAPGDVEREIRSASEDAYMKLMEVGSDGMAPEELRSYLASLGYSDGVANVALKRLISSRKAVIFSGRAMTVSALRSAGRDIREITIEKVFPGSAVAIIDGRWRARLEPANFNGPPSLIKKGSRFLASVELYRENGVLMVKVKDVERRL